MSRERENRNEAEAPSGLRQSIRRRLRAVAEREASRLARPDRPGSNVILAHASKSLSAVSSTPSGVALLHPNKNHSSNNTSNEWCGPFSVARQMIAAREEARIKRENEHNEKENESSENNPLDALVQQHELEKKRKAHPSMTWRGNRETIDKQENTSKDYYAKRRRRYNNEAKSTGRRNKIKTLFQLCIDFLVTNFEYVDSLGLVDGTIRNAICEELVAKGKFNGAAFEAIAEEGITALELVDCAKVTQDQLCEAFRKLIPAGLQAIMLNHSGRCFGHKAVQTLISSATEAQNLFALSIGGAYLLKDADLSNLIQTYQKSLSSLEFNACPNLGAQFCTSIARSFSSSINGGQLLELSIKDIPLSKDNMLVLGSTNALRNLKNIKMEQIPALDDEVVHSLLTATSSSSVTSNENELENQLEGINFSHNSQLSDAILSDIRSCNCSGQLRSLELSGLKNLTKHGLEAFFTMDIPGMPRAPMLRKLDLSGCQYDALTDTVLKLAALASSMKMKNFASSNTFEVEHRSDIDDLNRTGLSSIGGLVHLNLNGSSVTDESMEILAATCATSLEELNVSFCSQISDKGLGYLVEKAEKQLRKIHIWGCAQITDEFLDGHARTAEYGDGLEILGAWMKKSGVSSVR